MMKKQNWEQVLKGLKKTYKLNTHHKDPELQYLEQDGFLQGVNECIEALKEINFNEEIFNREENHQCLICGTDLSGMILIDSRPIHIHFCNDCREERWLHLKSNNKEAIKV